MLSEHKVTLIIWNVIVFFFLAIIMSLIIYFSIDEPRPQGYDCRFAEYPFAIDVPKEYLEACREAKRK